MKNHYFFFGIVILLSFIALFLFGRELVLSVPIDERVFGVNSVLAIYFSNFVIQLAVMLVFTFCRRQP